MSYGVAVGVVDKTGRFEPPDHFVLGHLSFGLSLPVGRRRARNGSLVWLSALPSAIGPIGC